MHPLPTPTPGIPLPHELTWSAGAAQVHSCAASTPAASTGTTEPAYDGIALSFVMVGIDPQQVQNSTLKCVIWIPTGRPCWQPPVRFL